MAKGYVQVFGKRKAIKYRKYSADLIADYGRELSGDAILKQKLYSIARELDKLADHCDPPDPFDGL